MYYRKFYSGSIDSSSYTSVTTLNGNISVYKNQTDVLCEALKDILTECGYEVTYENYMLTIDGFSFYIYYSGATAWTLRTRYYTTAIYSPGSGTSYQPFSSLNYQFYITVKGDPDGLMEVYIGTYSSIDALSYGFTIIKGKYIVDNSPILLLNKVGTNSSFWILAKEGNAVNGATAQTYTIADYLSSVSTLISNNNDTVPLIQGHTKDGFFIFDNCYLKPSSCNNSTFYSLNGEVFYSSSSAYIITKCINEVNT